MILMKNLGNNGRLGNQLFQIAFIISHAKKTGQEWALPFWEYSKYFNIKMKPDHYDTDSVSKEPYFDYIPDLEFRGDFVDISGFFQTEKYWDLDTVRESLTFNPGFMVNIVNRSHGIDLGDWAVHIRGGDYLNNPSYVQLPVDYYKEFIQSHPKNKFYIFSNDYDYCSRRFGELPNIEFVTGCSDIEHLALMSLFHNHLIANSTFSWWGARLAEFYNKKPYVIRPDGLFGPKLLSINGYTGKDFYPDRWEVRAIKKFKSLTNVKKHDLKHVTFIIPVKYDHKDRKENLELTIAFLNHWFDTNIIVGEQGKGALSDVKGCKYMHFDMDEFWRTKIINDMTRTAKTDIVFNWDADVLAPPAQIINAVEALKTNDFVYPFDGCFVRIGRNYIPLIAENMSLDVITTHNKVFEGSVGGAIGYNKEAFFRVGGENEHYLPHGKEDRDRYIRMTTLGTVKMIPGVLYHIDHFKGKDSRKYNPNTPLNEAEYRKVSNMNKDELQNYVNTWRWRQ